MVFENGVKNIQAAAYNGARTIHTVTMHLEAGALNPNRFEFGSF